MTLAEELLELALSMATQHGDHMMQAALRRSMSTAYYALFHLLVSEMTANYSQTESRAELGRAFEHRKMREACEQIRSAAQSQKRDDPAMAHLYVVADTFIGLQQKRELADYHTGRNWVSTEVVEEIARAQAAFEAWAEVRSDVRAQGFLVSLLRPRGRS